MDENRRIFSRVKFSSTAFLNLKELHKEVNLVDISLKGALVSSSTDLEIEKGETCVFEFHLSDSDIVMNINTQVVYKHENNFGLKFDNIDLESMIHLRRLVELNIGNSDQIQKELFFLVEPHK